jgi:hypothetical protein
MDKLIFEEDIPGFIEAVKTNPAVAVRILIDAGGDESFSIKHVAVLRDEYENGKYEKWLDQLDELLSPADTVAADVVD